MVKTKGLYNSAERTPRVPYGLPQGTLLCGAIIFACLHTQQHNDDAVNQNNHDAVNQRNKYWAQLAADEKLM